MSIARTKSIPEDVAEPVGSVSAPAAEKPEPEAKVEPVSSREINDEYRNFLRIIAEIEKKVKVCDDWKDWSAHPSYTNFEVPYQLKVRDRYHQKKVKYEQQFQFEISQIMNNLNTAYEVARLNRHLCITTLWPPLHNLCELIHTQRHYFQLSPKQRQRLNTIMSTKII